jgi:hypothetical protein
MSLERLLLYINFWTVIKIIDLKQENMLEKNEREREKQQQQNTTGHQKLGGKVLIQEELQY